MKTLSYVLILGLAILISCKHYPDLAEINKESVDTGDCDANIIYFEKDVLPILASNCAITGCHNSITKEEGFDFTNYVTSVAKGVKAGNASESKIYKVLVTNQNEDDFMPPQPMQPLTDSQIAIIYDWIEQGAKNLTCNPGECNMNNITYGNTISPIIQNKCTGCHSGTSPSGGVKITNYAELKSIIDDGSLLGTINDKTGYPIMPPAGKLPDCDIQQLEQWINDGALNN